MMPTEKLEPLHRLAEEIMVDDESGRLPLRYSKEDVIAATVVFSHILGAKFVQYLEDEKVGIAASRKMTAHLGSSISNSVEYATGIELRIKELV